MRTIYLISGPIGVGKSTVSRALAERIQGSLIVGDDLYNLEDEVNLEWSEKLQKGWNRILQTTIDQIRHNKNVIIDFVVEDELHWFINQLSGFDCRFVYVVLIADKETIIDRLKQRDDLRYKDRAMELLTQLSEDSFNKKYLVNTNHFSPIDTVKCILESSHLIVK